MNFIGTGGNDNLFGTKAHDVFDGLAGEDWMYGNGGDDWFYSYDKQGPDHINGGEGTDSAHIDRTSYAGDLILDLSKTSFQNIGDGTTLISVEQAEFWGGAGNDTLVGGDYADWLNGGRGSDNLLG